MKINNKIYNTKSEIINLIRKILNSNKKEAWLNDKDSKILLDLLKNHPSYTLKKGCGIKGFQIRKTQYGKNGFVLYRTDGSYTDFSYLQCISNPTLLTKIKQACRTAISEEIIKFKIKSFGSKQTIKCAISKTNLSFNNCHVDHYNPSFKNIFNKWIKDKNIIIEDITILKIMKKEYISQIKI